jgi:hypothetical protein
MMQKQGARQPGYVGLEMNGVGIDLTRDLLEVIKPAA